MWGYGVPLETRYYAAITLADQAHRQLMTYWKVRITKVLDTLETDVRRMLQVETALELFAQDYCTRLAPVAEALAAFSSDVQVRADLPREPFDWFGLGASAIRAKEMKRRYRALARTLHPDVAEGASIGMQQLNEAYARHDLAALVRLEAQSLAPDESRETREFEEYVRQVEAAAATYRQAYSQLLRTKVYALAARSASAQDDGWDWIESVARRVRRVMQEEAALAA